MEWQDRVLMWIVIFVILIVSISIIVQKIDSPTLVSCPQPKVNCSCPIYEEPDCQEEVIKAIRDFSNFQENLKEVLNESR